MSILNFEKRGPWGKSSWRGNCSGYIYQDLFNRLQPTFFVDPMVGSGTSIDVAKEMGIDCMGLDLHSGFNILRDSILETTGREADLILSHSPYADMVSYSGSVWGTEPHPDDLSHCKDDEDFNQKLQIAMINQREATKYGGVYGTIIGDYRRNGQYSSYQAECISRLPKEELLAVLIKTQHNTMSSRKTYGKMKLPFIEHEYILLFERKGGAMIHLLGSVAREQAARLSGTWKSIVRNVLISLGGKSTLSALYAKVADGCSEKLRSNPNWQAKVRQTLNSNNEFASDERGVWKLA